MTKTKKIILSAFIVFNFLTMVRVHLPLQNSQFLNTLYKPVDAYLSFFSIYQDWFMFAPDPSRLNVFVTAEVEFDDGSKDTFTFARPTDLNILEKYTYGERFRKLVSEGIRNDSHSWMWKDAARFALRKLKEKNFNKIPLKVHLIRHWHETPDLEVAFRPHLEKIKNFDSYRFYTYEVI